MTLTDIVYRFDREQRSLRDVQWLNAVHLGPSGQ